MPHSQPETLVFRAPLQQLGRVKPPCSLQWGAGYQAFCQYSKCTFSLPKEEKNSSPWKRTCKIPKLSRPGVSGLKALETWHLLHLTRQYPFLWLDLGKPD